jgi:hypothetical protein
MAHRSHEVLLAKLEGGKGRGTPSAPPGSAAFQRYGKGQGHPAQLNLGDCTDVDQC